MNTTIRIAGIVDESIVDGPGIRLVVFAQGCHIGAKAANPKPILLGGGLRL